MYKDWRLYAVVLAVLVADKVLGVSAMLAGVIKRTGGTPGA